MKFNKKNFLKSLYKISTVLFLVGYNFAPVALAAEEISNLEPDSNQSVSVTTEDTSEDILDEGISDPEGIAKGENVKGEEAQKSVSLQDTVSKKENDSQTKIEPKASPMGNSDFINITSVTVDNQSNTTVVRPGKVRVRVDATKNIPWGSTYYKLSNNKYACVVKSDTEGTTHEFDLDIGMDVGLGEYDLSITAYERSDCSTGWFWNPSYKSDTKVLAKAVKVQDAPNPLLGQTCGLDISLVLDTSGSIGSTKLQQMKEAFYLLIDSLKGTPTRFSLVEFNTKAYVRQDFTDDFELVKTKIAQFQSSGRTNWYDALLKSESTFDPRLDKADLIVFASDGNPNEPSNALNKAIEQANLIKGDDIRILGIAIGMNVNLNNMKAITGPNLNTGDFRTSDVISADFDTLADQLGKFASDTCGGSISINKYIGSLGTKGGAGWEFTVTPSDPLLKLVTDENGQVNSGELSVGTYSVIETPLSGHNFVSASCKKGSGILVGQSTKNGVKNIPVNADDIITCDFINDLSCKAGQHTLEGQIKGNGYTTGQLCAGGGECWAEGENVPARLTITGLEVGTSYSAIVSHDFENAYGKVGYDNFNNVHSGNNTATNITLSEPTIEGTGPTTKKYTITFTPTNSTVQLDWNALLSDEAGEWSGGSLHYRLEDGVCGGLGKREIPINPNQIQIKGSIKPIKSSENNIDPTQWSFNISGLVNVNNVASGEKATGLPLGANNANATYTITETGLSGYELVSVSEPCQLDNDGKVTVTLTKANPDVECTFVNKLMVGNIVVKKVTEPSGNTEVFTFTTTGTGYNGFTLTDATSNTQTLVPGTYTVSESLTELQKDNWYLKSSTCDSSIVGKSQSPSNLNLASGETVTCTFTNTQYGSISGHKWNDADGSDLTTDDRTGVKNWRIFIDENGDGKYDEGEKVLLTDENGYYKFEDLKPGTYVIVEDMDSLPGWYGLLEGFSHTVTIGAGENRENVDFVNVKYASIQVIKKVDTDGDGDIDVESATDWVWKINKDEYATGIDPVKKEAATYTISEVQKPDYHVTSMKCIHNGTEVDYGATTSKDITLKSGDNVVCTFTNTRDTGTLIVQKKVVNDNGGSLEADDFSFKIGDGDATNFIIKDVEKPLFGENKIEKVVTGTYSITEVEANTRGYATTNNCAEVVVKKGETTICTITNNDIAPELTVIKKVINEGNDGTKSAGDFAITVTGTNVSNSNFQGSENGVTVTLNAGSYKVTEDEDTEDYTASYDNCEGTINIGEKKTCTITNTGIDHLPSIVVTKDADKTAVNETGEDVTFTFTVKNTSKVDTVTILSLVDSKFGTLAGDDDCKVGTELVPGASCSFTLTKTIKGDAIGPDHENIFKATVKDEEGNETSDEDNHIIEFNDVLPTVEVTKDADKTSVDETGENVTFTFTVKNTSDENVTIATLTDSVFGTLVGDTDCKVGTELVPDASCTFTLTKLIKGDASGPDHENTFKAEVTDNEGNTAADTDTETIGFDDVLPTVEVTKEADKTSVDETGESVTFTFTVKNTSEENVTITTLTDSVFGALAGDDDCKVGTELAAGASCTFTLTKTIDGNASGPDHENVFTAVVTDNDGSTGEDTDNEIITFKDVEPSIEVTKTAGVTEIPETGGKVTFTYKVTNSGLEEVEITYLNDDQFGDLDGDDDCKVGTILGVGKSCTFAEEFEIPANEPGDPDAPTTHKNIFTAKAKDDEENEVEDEDTEEVKLTPVPSLKLVKNVVHKYNSDTNITAADWTLYATGDGGFDYAGDKDEFRFVKAGVPYTLSEEGIYSPRFEASNWVCNGVELTDSTIKLAAEDDVVCTITNTALPATVTVYKDVLDGYSNDIFKVQLEDGGKKLDISDTEDANKRLVAVFEGLDRGTYNPKEVELPDGYIAQGCVPLEGSSNTVENGMGIEFVCKNKVIDPLLQIEKSNDKQHIDQLAGNEVTYTITVTAPADNVPEGTYVLNNVVVSDIAPAGFKYILGSWTAQKNGVDIPVLEPTYDDANVAQWMIGDMKEGDVVVLTYRTRISLLQDPGNYPDIAWVAGTSLIDGEVLGASTVDPETPFVGTDVTVIEPVETEEGEVLGASITLPDTGASTYLTLGALIMMILGVITLLFKPFKKLSYALLTGLMALSFVTLLTPNRVLAEDEHIKVRIMQPATPTNKSNFNVGFVALDLKNNSITVECYKDAVLFETIPNVNTGNCPAKVDASGTYTFYVVAKSTSGEQKSADVTVVVDLEKPSPVIDYSKAGNVLKFKTANDGKTKKVEIHRSTTPKYTANEGTRVHSMDVLPNTGYSWTDTTAEAGKTYYYALRTVDAVGNVSTIVSDPEVKIVPPTTTGTGTTATVTASTEGEVAGQTDTKTEGEVAGEADDLVEGEEKDVEKTEETKEDTKVDLKETGKKILNKWYIWVVAILVLGGVAFYVKKQKSN